MGPIAAKKTVPYVKVRDAVGDHRIAARPGVDGTENDAGQQEAAFKRGWERRGAFLRHSMTRYRSISAIGGYCKLVAAPGPLPEAADELDQAPERDARRAFGDPRFVVFHPG